MEKLFCASIGEYLELERETIRVLNESKYIKEGCQHTNLQSVYSQSRGDEFSAIDLYLRFCSSAFGAKSHDVSLGGYFQCGSNALFRATYSVEVFGPSGSADMNKIVSRMHFDYASREEQNAGQHPVFHVQTWGKLPQYLRDEGVGYQFEDNSAMSCPRVPFAPLSLALFVNMMIKELGTEKLRRLLGSSEWRRLVMQHEKKILMPFIDRLKNCLSSGAQLSKFYYAER